MRFLAIAALAIMPAAAEAATYTLSGSGVTGCTAGEFEDCSRFDGASLDGKIIIKGARLGGLAWRNLVWEVNGAGESVGLPLRLLNLALPELNTGIPAHLGGQLQRSAEQFPLLAANRTPGASPGVVAGDPERPAGLHARL